MLRFVTSVALSLTIAGLARAQPADAVAESMRLFASKDWPASIKAHEALVRERPQDTQAWLRLGISLQGAARYADSIPPLEEAARLGAPAVGAVQLRLAKAYARTGSMPKTTRPRAVKAPTATAATARK